MQLLILSPGFDTAGVGASLKHAFDVAGGEWSARHVRLWDNAYHYPGDVQWDRENAAQTRDVEALWNEADAVVILEHPDAAEWFPTPKPTIVYHLGTYYRRNRDKVDAQVRTIGALAVVDMHDLMRYGDHPWLPDPIDPAPLEAIRRAEYTWSDRVRIAHAPTDRAIKSTDVIVPVIERIMRRRHQVAFDLIERVSNEECIRRKARADIFVDELTLGYGINALEVWSMGIPDVSGIADPDTRHRMVYDSGVLPFVEVTADTLEEQLERLVLDRDYRSAYGRLGRAHVERFHAPAAVVARTLGLFDRLAVAA